MEKIKQKLKDFFKDINFREDGHIYDVNGQTLKYSVSGLIKLFSPVFDTEGISLGTAKKYGKSQEQVLQEWEDEKNKACDKGNVAHLFGENYMLDRSLKPSTGLERAIVKFWGDLPEHIVPTIPELQMYHKEYLFAGTADVPLYNKITKKHIIADYKGLPVDTKILTEKGWSTMGTIKRGDKVFDKEGELCSVINTSEIKNKKCFEIFFDNGESIISDFEHRWEVSFVNSGTKKDVIMTTEEIKNYRESVGNLSYQQMRIYNPKPLKNKEKELPIDPYVLGIWLGDGHSIDAKVTQQNSKVWEELEKRGYSLGKDLSQGEAGTAQTRTVFGLQTKLKDLGLLKNKHIPVEYLLSSEDQRLDLLRGFMDADGYFNIKRSRYVMATTRKEQVDFFLPLLGSLGIKPSVIKANKYCNGKIFKGYDVCFTTLLNPFLCRNQNIKFKTNDQHKYRRIVTVKEVPSVPTRCIEVSSSSHTFLYGESFIVTHNTNKDLFKNFNKQKLLSLFQDLLDCPFSKYQIQLSFYQLLMEQVPEVEVSHRKIIWLKDDGSYLLYDTIDYTDKLSKFLKNNIL